MNYISTTDQQQLYNFLHDTHDTVPGCGVSGYWHWSPSADTKQDVDSREGVALQEFRGRGPHEITVFAQSLKEQYFENNLHIDFNSFFSNTVLYLLQNFRTSVINKTGADWGRHAEKLWLVRY